MNKRLKTVAAAFVALFIFIFESPAPARGQVVGVYRVRQGRRVGRITLPTPPFNPDAGILGSGRPRVREAPKRGRRRATRRAATRHTAPKPSVKRARGRR